MMNVLKYPYFFRPSSQPASPTSSPVTPRLSNDLERAPRSHNKLTLNTFRRPSPSPVISLSSAPPTLVQDGSYLEVLNLKLSEAVSKALAQPTGPAAANEQLFGRRPIPQGRGQALGAFIAAELTATQDSPHLRRAFIRTLHRPLSVLLTNLSAHLLPLISSTAFQHAPAPTVQSPNPNPTQVHALAIVTFVEELLSTFDELDLGTDADVRGDGLKPIREGLVSLINRVVTPLVTNIRNELIPLLDALETPSASNVSKAVGVKPNVVYHSSITAMQTIMPIYAKALTRYTSSAASQATLATFLISIVWRGLVALSHRPYLATSPPPSPSLIPVAVKRSFGTSSPPQTPPAARFNIIHPSSRPSSRPPSPQMGPVPATTAGDARALYDILRLLPLPMGDKVSAGLAREVVDDAFESLQALPHLLEAVYAVPRKIDSQWRLNETARELEILATKVPLLIAIPVFLQAPINGVLSTHFVSSIVGLSETQYRSECLSGFGRAEECSTAVASRILVALNGNLTVHPVVSKWLEMEIIEATEQLH